MIRIGVALARQDRDDNASYLGAEILYRHEAVTNIKIASVGVVSADENVDFVDFDSNASLLDYDLIIFRIPADVFRYSRETYQGKPCLSDDASFKLKERTAHWRREIKEAAEGGKIVFMFLTEYVDGYVATGEMQYSGSGRNRQTTRIVQIFNNYNIIPTTFKFTPAHGSNMILTKDGANLFADYWSIFCIYSRYHVHFDQKDMPGYIVTKSGSRPVGSVLRTKNSTGAVVILPDLNFDDEEFSSEDPNTQEEIWTEKAVKFYFSLTQSLVKIRTALQSGGEITPQPEWAKNEIYRSTEEIKLINQIADKSNKIEKMILEKENLEASLTEAESLKGLLYEKGAQLEKAVIKALKILGYQAENFNEGGLEIDAVFYSEEGRLIGEVEGKDNKQINITKLRQISLNIHEDLDREEIDTPAKGVLFGNAHRLSPIEARENTFTEKCITAAKVGGISLVSTPELFSVAKYVFDNQDMQFASECRRAIWHSVGIVKFPSISALGFETATSTVTTAENQADLQQTQPHP